MGTTTVTNTASTGVAITQYPSGYFYIIYARPSGVTPSRTGSTRRGRRNVFRISKKTALIVLKFKFYIDTLYVLISSTVTRRAIALLATISTGEIFSPASVVVGVSF